MNYNFCKNFTIKHKIIAGFYIFIYLFAILPSQYFHHFLEKKHEKHFACKAVKNIKHFHKNRVKCLLNEWRIGTSGCFYSNFNLIQEIDYKLSKRFFYCVNYDTYINHFFDSRGPPTKYI